MGRSSKRQSLLKQGGFDSKLAGGLILGVSLIGLICILYSRYIDSNSTTSITICRVAIGLFMIFGGLAHFDSKKMAFYKAIMPPIFAFKEELIYFTGITEAIGGLLMLFETTLFIGAYLTIANLIIVYPANIYCVISKNCRETTGMPLSGALFRLPLQLIFLEMAYICIAK